LNPTPKSKVKYDFPRLRVKDNHNNIYKAVRLDYIDSDNRWIVYIVPDMKNIISAILATTNPPTKPDIAVSVKSVIAKKPHDLKLFMGLLNLKTELGILKGLQPKFFKPYDTLKDKDQGIFSEYYQKIYKKIIPVYTQYLKT
jgi:hypothetical protein